MMISVLVGVTRTSTPEYPSSASSLVRNSLSSALKTPSATNFLFFDNFVHDVPYLVLCVPIVLQIVIIQIGKIYRNLQRVDLRRIFICARSSDVGHERATKVNRAHDSEVPKPH